MKLEMIEDVSLDSAFNGILYALASGWNCYGDGSGCWTTWNTSETNSFFSPEIRWANLEIMP
jgi:hypothetical protein